MTEIQHKDAQGKATSSDELVSRVQDQFRKRWLSVF